MPARKLKVLAFNCTLKSAHGREKSSTDALLKQFLEALEEHGATGEIVRAVDHNIKPGVKSDQGDGDDWPALRKRVLERMDAFLDETDDKSRMPSYGKVACAVIVGNEDGAHHTSAEICQALFEVGFTIPPGGATYWVGEAMTGKEYKDLYKTPKAVAEWNPLLASNVAHLARWLKEKNYPGV
jgi:multimeric flavodoxin WrbA